MRVVTKLEVVAAQDNDLLRKIVNETLSVDDAAMTTFDATNDVLTAAQTKVINFGSVTSAKYILVLAMDIPITVDINGAGLALRIEPEAAAAAGSALSTIQSESRPGVLWISGGTVTSMTIINTSALVTAEVYVALIGEQ